MKVSVLLTTFNSERDVVEAVRSVFAQDVDFSWELLICDDGSSDQTRTLLRDIARRHKMCVRLYLPETNLGYSGAEIFARGLQMCSGDYIATLDGDDYWTDSEKLNSQVGFLDHHLQCLLCFHNALVTYVDGRYEPWRLYAEVFPEMLGVRDVLHCASIQTSTLMFRREMVRDYLAWRERMGPAGPDDWTMAVLAALRGPVGYLDRVMSVYRQHSGGIWAKLNSAQQLTAVISRYQRIRRIVGSEHDEVVEREICVRSYEASTRYEALGELKMAALYLKRCLVGKPIWLEAYYAGLGSDAEGFRRSLVRRLNLYSHPALFHVWKVVAKIASMLQRARFDRTVARRRSVRAAAHLSTGEISAFPNPSSSSRRSPGLASAVVKWKSAGADVVEIRIGRPDGPLFTRSTPSGEAVTGEWVCSGMMFFLQDVSEGRPLTAEHTLDRVRVTVADCVSQHSRFRQSSCHGSGVFQQPCCH